tara:strand:+ start:25749 stop:26864 length:1116 start_codon:yes stop_codon:yes gene_type:complete
MMDKVKTEVLIIGAGIIGLACAKHLSEIGFETIVVEKSNIIADSVSSRNSGVIHSGIYYKNNSLKAKFCVDGKNKLYEYASKRRINHKKVGKIIFGSSVQEDQLIKLYENGINNGLKELSILNFSDLKRIEPNIKAEIGLLVGDTGIIDVTEYALAMENDIQKNKSYISKNTIFNGVNINNSYFCSEVSTGLENFIIESKFLIIACGLESYNVSQRIPFLKNNKKIKKLNLTKGHYYKINGKYPFNHLIYPLPGKFGLGIHSSFDLSGNTRFGPDAEKIDKIDYSFSLGSKEKFIEKISEYWPEIREKKLYEDYIGIRPKTQPADGSFEDFSILTNLDHEIDNLFFLQGIESPGLTSSLAIGEYISNLIAT